MSYISSIYEIEILYDQQSSNFVHPRNPHYLKQSPHFIAHSLTIIPVLNQSFNSEMSGVPFLDRRREWLYHATCLILALFYVYPH